MVGGQDDFVIVGVTEAGARFRPSDWAERLCGMMSIFPSDCRLRYSSYLKPVMLGAAKCVAVCGRLKDQDPAAYDFLLQFARGNELSVRRGVTALSLHQSEQQPAPAPSGGDPDLLVA